MFPARLYRSLFVGSVFGVMGVVIALTGWLLWPRFERWWALRELVEAGRAKNAARFLDTIEKIDRLPQTTELVDDLVMLVKHKDRGVRTYAIVALASLWPRPKEAVPALIEVLDDSDENNGVRAAAAAALRLFGADAMDAVPALNRASKEVESLAAFFVTGGDDTSSFGYFDFEGDGSVAQGEARSLIKNAREAVAAIAPDEQRHLPPFVKLFMMHFASRPESTAREQAEELLGECP